MTENRKFVCIHGHFYQPPRENPWLEEIERQDSAAPHHDWNERILAECYQANAASRILDENDRIADIVNNYASISFNFGPTLLAWMELKAPETYAAILEADRISIDRFGGHGSALAQAYNHIILPLANDRDLDTQVHWGIEDFRYRFGRMPEGMWLPETAVDLRALECLAARGIRFTILDGSQAARFRRIGEENWTETSSSGIDPRRPYRAALPSGAELALFFYDGPVSRAVAFEKLLDKGERFADRLIGAFSCDDPSEPELVHIATDGETYGHHHRFGDMALAFALHQIEKNRRAELTNYGRYLELHPPEWEVEIHENTAWSCAHGVGRWKNDCGCHTGAHPNWNQAWRGPLREALDRLRDRMAPLFEAKAGEIFQDPWEARNDSIRIFLNPVPETLQNFLENHRRGEPGEEARRQGLELMELQFQLQRMYTSCGWFFDDLAGIETVQILQYAGRAIQLGESLFDRPFLPAFLDDLQKAEGNLHREKDGRTIYRRRVQPKVVDLLKVGAHFAAAALFEPLAEVSEVFRYTVERLEHDDARSGKMRLDLSRIQVTDRFTTGRTDLACCAFHLGDHNLMVGVRPYLGAAEYRSMVEETRKLFQAADTPGLLRAIDCDFPDGVLTLKALFRDEQLRVLNRILETTLEDTTTVYRRLYRQHAPLMRFLAELDVTPPGPLHATADFVLNADLEAALRQETPDPDQLRTILEEMENHKAALDEERFRFDLAAAVERWMRRYSGDLYNLEMLNRLVDFVRYVLTLQQPFDLRAAGDLYYDLRAGFQDPAREPETGPNATGEEERSEWLVRFRELGDLLGFRAEATGKG